MKKLIVKLLILLLSSGILLVYEKEFFRIDEYKKLDIQENRFPTSEEIVNYLCSDFVGDREIGKYGNEIATKYIEDLFTLIKLDKVFNDSYLQEFNENKNLINNVVGKITGINNQTVIVLTAHLDAWYNGALDNASGIATVLGIANNLKNQSEKGKLKYDIIFCITNAEMSLFAGSRKFVSDITSLYKNVYNINIDCVGAKEAGPIALKNISRVEKSKRLYEQIKKNFKENDIKFIDDFSTEKVKNAYEEKIGVSDYAAFEEKEIPNIHIAQKGIEPFILNQNDNPENLDYIKIQELSDVISIFINEIDLEE